MAHSSLLPVVPKPLTLDPKPQTDIAHAKLKERLDDGNGLPDYVKNHLIYYAGPAKTPDGMPSGSFGTKQP
jgi:hypothetical protein